MGAGAGRRVAVSAGRREERGPGADARELLAAREPEVAARAEEEAALAVALQLRPLVHAKQVSRGHAETSNQSSVNLTVHSIFKLFDVQI